MNQTMRRLKIKQQKIQRDIDSFRATCPHPTNEVCYHYGSSTGNWCRADDSYWTDFYCGRCGGQWTEEGSVHQDGNIRVERREDLVPKESE